MSSAKAMAQSCTPVARRATRVAYPGNAMSGTGENAVTNEIRKSRSSTVLALSVVAAMSLCLLPVKGRAADPGITDDEILIGMFGPMSGPFTPFGIDPIQAGKMWYEEVNKKGGIHGRKIRVRIEDDKCSQNEAVSVVKKLISVDHVFALNGGGCTAAVAALQELVAREQIPLLTGVAAGDTVAFPPRPYIFTGFGATQHAVGATLVQFAADQFKAKRIALIALDDDYGKAFVEVAQHTAARLGVEIADIERIPSDITDVTAPLLRIRSANPDVILSAALIAPAVLIAQKYGEFAMTNIPLVQAVQGIPSPNQFAKNVGSKEALQNFYFQWVILDLVDPALRKKWIDLYKQYYPERTPGPFLFAGLPSAMTMTAALEKAGRNVTRESFLDAIQTLDLKLEVFPDNTTLTKTKHDLNRTTFFIKFDGENMDRMPGLYRWNGTD